VIGAPGRTVDGRSDAGAVTVVSTDFKAGNTLRSAVKVWQDSPGVSGTFEAGTGSAPVSRS